MKRLCLLLPLLFFLLPGCKETEAGQVYQLYFQPASYTAGPALLPFDFLPEEIQTPLEEVLIETLLAGPEDPTLRSPFPKGVSLRSWSLQGGLLQVNLSEQYGGLSGMALTIADHAIALTLCQLPHVDGVTIKVANDPMPFRYHQILTPDNILLTDLPEKGSTP